MPESGEFNEAVQHRLSRLRAELAEALVDDDYGAAAWAESAIQDLQRLHRENSADTTRSAVACG